MADKSDLISSKGGISSALSASIKRVILTTDSTATTNRKATTSSFVQEIDLEINNQSRSPIRTR